MRVLGRLLEAVLVFTFLFGVWARRRRRRMLAGGKHWRCPPLWTYEPARDPVPSGHVGGIGWEAYIAPPAASESSRPRRKRLYRHRRARPKAELRRQARRRLARLRRLV